MTGPTGRPKTRPDSVARPPRASDRVGRLSRYPPPYLAITRFGTWAAALTAAGLEPGNTPHATPEAIAQALRAYHSRHGRSATMGEWDRQRMSPATSTIARRCGGWHAALALAGLPAADRPAHRISDDELLDALRDHHRRRGEIPNADTWRWQGHHPAAKTIMRRFGSWAAAVERARL
jgi:hypothetical protein